MKKLSDLTIRKISELIAVSPKAYELPAGAPDRPAGGYRTWKNLILFLKEIDPLIPSAESAITNLIHDIKRTDKDISFSREDMTYELLKIWNDKDPNIFKKIFDELLTPVQYFPGEESEILRVYSLINVTLNEERLFLGGFPIKIFILDDISVDEKAKLEWDTLWYLASKIFLTDKQLKEKVSSLMLQGHFNDVARNAAEIPFDILRKKSKELKNKDGEDLITVALRKDSILFYGYSDSNIEEWARRRLAAKLSALYQAYRNPSSHHFKIESPWEAMLAIWNANWCIGEIEKLSEKDDEENKIPF